MAAYTVQQCLQQALNTAGRLPAHVSVPRQPTPPHPPPCSQYVLVYPAAPMVNTYYETAPNCKEAVRALLNGTIVHYTGALVRGNPWLGCRPEKYAKVVLEVSCALQPSLTAWLRNTYCSGTVASACLPTWADHALALRKAGLHAWACMHSATPALHAQRAPDLAGDEAPQTTRAVCLAPQSCSV